MILMMLFAASAILGTAADEPATITDAELEADAAATAANAAGHASALNGWDDSDDAWVDVEVAREGDPTSADVTRIARYKVLRPGKDGCEKAHKGAQLSVAFKLWSLDAKAGAAVEAVFNVGDDGAKSLTDALGEPVFARKRTEPLKINIGKLPPIPLPEGFQLALRGMCAYEKRALLVPPDLAWNAHADGWRSAQGGDPPRFARMMSKVAGFDKSTHWLVFEVRGVRMTGQRVVAAKREFEGHVRRKEMDAAMALAREHKLSMYTQVVGGHPAWFFPSQIGDVDMLGAFVQHEADPSGLYDMETRMGITALMFAAGYDHDKFVDALLTLGADPNRAITEKKNHAKLGWTALHFAVRKASVQSAMAIVEHGGDVDAKTARGLTPLNLLEQEIAKSKIEHDKKAKGPRHDREVSHYKKIVKRHEFLTEVFEGQRKRRKLQQEAAAAGQGDGSHLHADPKEEL